MRDALSLRRTSEMLAGALGPAISTALGDPDITEIMVNPDGRLWFDRYGEGRVMSGHVLTAADVERVIRLVASHIGCEATAYSPIVSAELPISGERFEGCLPPVTPAPCFSIRKPAGRIIGLDEYIASGVMPAHHADALRAAITDKSNILIVPNTGHKETCLF